MAPTTSFVARLPAELVAEVASHLGDKNHYRSMHTQILPGKYPHSKDVSNFALVSKQFGAGLHATFHSVVYGAKSWELGEDTPRASGSDTDTPMAKLNLRPWNTYQCSLLGSTYPTGCIRTVVFTQPHRGNEDSFFNVSPSKLREVLLALPRLETVVFAQTVALNEPARRVAGGPMLKVSHVYIQQRGGNQCFFFEQHLPRLLSIFDEIEELEYASDHTQSKFEAVSDPSQPLVKVSKLRFMSLNIGNPSGALKAMAALLDCAILQDIDFSIASWSVYKSCAATFNDILNKTSNLKKLALHFPDASDDQVCTCSVGNKYCLRHGRNPPRDHGPMPARFDASISLASLKHLRELYLAVDPYGYGGTWAKIIALYRDVMNLEIETIDTLLYYENSDDDRTLVEHQDETPNIKNVAYYADTIKSVLSDGCKKLRSFTFTLWTHKRVYDELRGAFDASVRGSRAEDLIEWEASFMDEDEGYLEAKYWEEAGDNAEGEDSEDYEDYEDSDVEDDEEHMEIVES